MHWKLDPKFRLWIFPCTGGEYKVVALGRRKNTKLIIVFF